MFAISQCFVINSGREIRPHAKYTPIANNSVDLYFTRLFSLLAWHTLEMYYITIGTAHKRDISTFCINADSLYRPPFAHMKNILRDQSLCEQSNTTRRISLVTQNLALPTECQGNMLKCKDKSCVSYDGLYLRQNDCLPSNYVCHTGGQEIRDVNYCLNICTPSDCICPQHNFQCTCGGCIEMILVCDGVINCRDASDELCNLEYIDRENEECTETRLQTLINDKYFCLAFLCFSGECISIRYVNDLLADCSSGQGEDEPLFTQLRENKIYIECSEPDTIPCVPGLPNCFPLNKFCHYDFNVDGNTLWCRDGSHLGDCAAINCSNSYKCPESYCIPVHRVCDGHPDCIHGEDEDRCDEYICEGLLRCTSTRMCVHPVHVCDGISHCPNADDEKMCNVGVCPDGCDCLPQSIICKLRLAGVFPTMRSQAVKHILVIESHIIFPDFHGICNLQKLLILNLSRNHIKAICGALENDCKFYKKLSILDLSYNDIHILRSLCFQDLISLRVLSLAFNPLHTLGAYSLSLSSVTYISIRGTRVNALIKNMITRVDKLEIFDATDTDLSIIDSETEVLLSDSTHLLFNDHRLCCIWKGNARCRSLGNLPRLCPTLLPHLSIGYLVFASGSLLIIINIVAFFVNHQITKIGNLSKLISLLMCVDGILAMYLPFIGAAEIYYNRHIVLYAMEWQQGIPCRFMEVLTATTTMMLLCVSPLLIGLTTQGVTKITLGYYERWRNIIHRLLTSFVIIVITQISFVFVKSFNNISILNEADICNIMGKSQPAHWADVVSISALCILMLVGFLFVSCSAYLFCSHITQVRNDVKKISDNLNSNTHHRRGVYKYMIVLVSVKALDTLPYPLLRIISFVYHLPEDIYLYAVFAYIISESLSNPILFVFRPLLTARRNK